MTAEELRQKFLDFFKSKDHTIIPSASLIPKETDPSVLFTTAGMQQFKQYYLNPNETKDARIATSQKCIRTSDINEVGDETHLTFFEMLGNFSFGYPAKESSYFKKETIEYGWEFLTKTLGINESRIYVTYFKGGDGIPEDKESLEILKGIDKLKDIKSQGAEDNFWSLKTEGSPGGPTVEFYVDGMEVWNCVFNEYALKNGGYKLSENKGVDTGMGLERLLAAVKDKKDIFQTELFQPIFDKISQLGHPMSKSDSNKLKANEAKSYRIIADHIKAAVFIIADGVVPSNTDQGYVLRRLIRRAVRHGKLLGINDNFLLHLASIVVKVYNDFYPELEENKNKIFKELEAEENKFNETLEKGLKKFNEIVLGKLNKIGKAYDQNFLYGSDAFDLYQTYGFPKEMIQELCNENNIGFDEDGFNEESKKHQELSRTASAGKFKGGLEEAGEETAKLHTATHLLLAALRQVLGDNVYQKGSNITAERLRFDFNYSQKLSEEQIKEIESLVNEKIKESIPVEMEEMSKDGALKIAKVSFDPSKYGDMVKVYKIGNFSTEVCGGPHVKSTGELGNFRIVKEESSSAGIRRIRAVLE